MEDLAVDFDREYDVATKEKIRFKGTVTNLYAGLMALLMFAEVMPFVGWKVAVHTKQKILLQQNSVMLFIYAAVVCALSFFNVAKGIVFFLFILSQNLNTPFLGKFLTTSLTEIDSLKNARREGAFTLLSETILILMVIITIQKYRPLVISAKDAIYYRSQMVASLSLALLDELHLSSLRDCRLSRDRTVDELLRLHPRFLLLPGQLLPDPQF